jgi:hypothetical protein
MVSGNRGMFLEMFNGTGVTQLTDAAIGALTDTPVWSGWLGESGWKQPLKPEDEDMDHFVSR